MLQKTSRILQILVMRYPYKHTQPWHMQRCRFGTISPLHTRLGHCLWLVLAYVPFKWARCSSQKNMYELLGLGTLGPSGDFRFLSPDAFALPFPSSFLEKLHGSGGAVAGFRFEGAGFFVFCSIFAGSSLLSSFSSPSWSEDCCLLVLPALPFLVPAVPVPHRRSSEEH